MTFELSDRPQYLEISDPSKTLIDQVSVILEHHKHWIEAYDLSVAEVDLGMHAINAAFRNNFNELLALRPEDFGPNVLEAHERVRQHTSNLLAMSGLARRLTAHPDFKAGDARADKKAPHIMLRSYHHYSSNSKNSKIQVFV